MTLILNTKFEFKYVNVYQTDFEKLVIVKRTICINAYPLILISFGILIYRNKKSFLHKISFCIKTNSFQSIFNRKRNKDI